MHIKFVGLLALLLIVLGMTMGAAAQDVAQPCKVADVLDVEYQGMVQRDWLQTVIVTLNANIKDDDIGNFLGTARELRRVLARADANCRGLHFTSDSEGMSPVIGPVSISGGIWRATLTTDGFASVKLETIEGDCGDEKLPFNVFDGDAKDGAQKVIKTGMGCQALISLENTSKPWDLMFELVKATDQ